jgi:uncharacterized heparinase superfamily protein
VAVAHRRQISSLLLGRAARSVLARASGRSIVLSRFWPRRTDRLLIAPNDLRTVDATRASEVYAGRFVFAGKIVTSHGRSVFDLDPPSEDWEASLLGFGWLRHLRAADSAITRANARSLIDDWISKPIRKRGVGWRADVLARRVMSLLSQAPLVLNDADSKFYRRFLRSLTREIRYLRSTMVDIADGVPRLQVLIALCYASLCLAQAVRRIAAAVAAGRRPHLAQPGRADRTAAGPAAAAPDLCGAQCRAAAGVAQRHRPHDADAALLPPRRRQRCAVQRHGHRALGPACHSARL